MQYRVELGSEVNLFPSLSAAVDWLERQMRTPQPGFMAAHIFDRTTGRLVALISRTQTGEILFSFIGK